MNLPRTFFLTIAVSALLFRVAVFSQSTVEPNLKVFNEALKLIQTHLIGSEKDEALDQKALQGLVDQLSPAIQLLVSDSTETQKTGEVESTDEEFLCKSQLFDSHYLSLRLGEITLETPEALLAELQNVSQTNELKGIILDLRNSAGADYKALASITSFFIPSGQSSQVFTIKGSEYSISPSTDQKAEQLSRLPTIILINGKTSDAAEILAATLNKARQVLLIGSPTAGDTISYKDFELSNNQVLKIAVDSVCFQDGTWLMPGGIQPDIKVAVSMEDEQAYLDDPFTSRRPVYVDEARATTNRAAVRINEAELVKMQNSGTQSSSEQVQKASEPLPPALYDPSLARALDILKTLPFFEISK